MRKAEKLRRHNAAHDDIAEQNDAMLSTQISLLDQRIKAIIAADRALAEQAALMRAVPGIGPPLMAVPPGELPELGTLCRRKIAYLAGLAPHAHESGTWKGARQIRSGRHKVRSCSPLCRSLVRVPPCARAHRHA